MSVGDAVITSGGYGLPDGTAIKTAAPKAPKPATEKDIDRDGPLPLRPGGSSAGSVSAAARARGSSGSRGPFCFLVSQRWRLVGAYLAFTVPVSVFPRRIFRGS